ncbi:MAG: hypothetical protein IIA41_12350 [SAR324 cluster bacterium]|nr:hypothetical protein [SAR324 cluster bacterium]
MIETTARGLRRAGIAAVWGLSLAILVAGCAQDNVQGSEATSQVVDVPADEAWLLLVNCSAETIVEVNLVQAGTSDGGWGSSQLEGQEIFPNGPWRLRQITCPDTLDMRALTDLGAEYTRLGLEFLCATQVEITITEFP